MSVYEALENLSRILHTFLVSQKQGEFILEYVQEEVTRMIGVGGRGGAWKGFITRKD